MGIFWKLAKFILVGFSGMAIDFGITWSLKEKVRINKYIANSAGFISAASSNYFLNRIWTFESQRQDIRTEYLSFIGVSVIGLLLNTLIVYFFTEKRKTNFYIAKLVAILLVTLWNFTANNFFTFR